MTQPELHLSNSQIGILGSVLGLSWAIAGLGIGRLSDATGQEMVSVFVPSSPTAFSGYVLVVPKETVVELPLKVDEAMRLLVSGGVIAPGSEQRAVTRQPPVLAGRTQEQ